ncbi:hypothetical protein ACLBYG_19325 [Methylobacterium sp. D53M]|jgi:hypothetical protein
MAGHADGRELPGRGLHAQAYLGADPVDLCGQPGSISLVIGLFVSGWVADWQRPPPG